MTGPLIQMELGQELESVKMETRDHAEEEIKKGGENEKLPNSILKDSRSLFLVINLLQMYHLPLGKNIF